MAGRVYQTLINIIVFIIILLNFNSIMIKTRILIRGNVEFGLISLEKVTLFLR